MKLCKSVLGFTLLELLAVIVILSLLSSIVISGISGFVSGGEEAATTRRIQTLNLALDQARIRKDNPILYTGTKWEVYEYLKTNGFLIGGEEY